MAKVKCVAVIDGSGPYSTVGLYWEEDGLLNEHPWPPSWPEAVSEKFLREHGFEVIHT